MKKMPTNSIIPFFLTAREKFNFQRYRNFAKIYITVILIMTRKLMYIKKF